MTTKETLAIHPAPVTEEPATDYKVTVNGLPVFTYRARVSAQPFNQEWPGYQRPLDQTEIASFANWDMAKPVQVRIVSARPVNDVRVRPTSYGIQAKVEGRTISFTLKKPGQLTVEVNGTHHALHLFANPIESAPPDPKDRHVRYFGPGVHYPGLIRMRSNQTVYIAGGAVVYGAIVADRANNIVIRGRGILDGSKFERSGWTKWTSLIETRSCKGVTIDGIILRDPNLFTVVPIVCQDVHIRNVKLIGLWRYNTDGIDFLNSERCSVEDSFIRSFDDSVVFKGVPVWAGFKCNLEPIRDIQVRRCVIWNEWGRALEVGAETVASEISNLLFEDCDVIHTTHIAMDVQNTDQALCKNMIFRNIRVELDDDLTRPVLQDKKEAKYTAAPGDQYIPALIVLEISHGQWSHDADRGRIEDIQFQDISVTAHGTPPSYLKGFDAEHLVRRVAIGNLQINGRAVASLADGGITTGEFTRDVTIRAEPNAKRILFLGNSITLHGPKADIGWTGNWGMAASAQQKDYVHLLLQRFAARAGGAMPEARIENIADFEREYRTCDVREKCKTFSNFKADTVILAIGENVPALLTEEDKAAFHKAATALLRQVTMNQSQPPNIYIRSTFWPDTTKDAVLRQVCQDVGGTFVDIGTLGRNETNYARSERQFTDAGVAAHPGDTGMAAIAEAIWSAMAGSLIQ